MKSKIILLSLVLSIFYLGCKNVPTFEKDGGIRLVITISYSDFLKAIIAEGYEGQLQEVLTEIKEDQIKDFDGFVNSFRKVEEKKFPEIKLATIFMKPEWGDKINFNSTNEEVLKVLKNEWEAMLLSTNSVIKIRLGNIQEIGVSTIKNENGNQILVEVPGGKDPIRIQNLLTSIGELGFWETYSNTEIFPYLNQINDYLGKAKFQNKAHENSKNENDVSGLPDSSSTLTSQLENQKIYAADSSASRFPLFSLLTSSDGLLITGSAIGSVMIKDTAELSKLFQMDSVLHFLPHNCKLLFSKPIQLNDNTYCELIALKGNRLNGPMINGSVITNATALLKENRNEISMKMNSEGARIWKRMTADNVGRQIAITVDGVVYVHPTVQSQIEGGNSNITGNFTREEATDLALVLNSGKYPVKLNILKTEVIEVKK